LSLIELPDKQSYRKKVKMTTNYPIIGIKKRIALIAHDHKKRDLLDWANFNRGTLSRHHLFGTGTTGRMLEEDLELPITQFKSGPVGGDQQIGSKISEGEIDFLIFFWDPLEPQPHDPDIKALLRLAVLYNIPTASNRATADFLISSPLMTSEYEHPTPDLDRYQQSRRNIG
jgi:methylglyoxal synthase